MEARAEGVVQAANTENDEAMRVVGVQDKAVQQAKEAYEGKVADCRAQKKELASAAKKFQEMKMTLRDTEEKRALGDVEVMAAGRKMKEVEGLLEDVDTLFGNASKIA